jgi:hypothetical protein
MNENRETQSTTDVRASDAERERVAKIVSDAAGEGRLTLEEAEQRLELIYATTFRHELGQHIADLPADLPAGRRDSAQIRGPGGRFPNRLRIHAAIVLVLSVAVIVRWATLGTPFFFPVFPVFFLVAGLLVHARVLSWRRGAGPWRPGTN